METIEQYLINKGCIVKPAGHSEVHTHCFYCNEPADKRGRLYINTDMNAEPLGLFSCFLCGESGGFNKIRKHFGDPIIQSGDDYTPDTPTTSKQHAIMQAAASYYYDKLADNKEAFEYLREDRGLSFETIEKHKLGWADGGLTKFLMEERGYALGDLLRSGLTTEKGEDFHQRKITIPYHRYGSVVTIRGKDMNGKYRGLPGAKSPLFNADSCFNTEQLVICEGEFDCMMMEQMGFTAVGLPGAATWQDDWTPMLEDVKTVFVCLDIDAAGKSGADKTALKVGNKARIVTLPEEVNLDGSFADVSDLVNKFGYSEEEFKMLLIRSRGGMLLSVREAYDRWLDVEGNPDLQGLRIGMSVIDNAITPGLLPGQVMITLAKTGVGKTISMLNMFHNILEEDDDASILFLSLEQTRNEWFERAQRIYRFYHPWADPKEVLAFYENRFLLTDKNRVTEDDLVSCVEQFEYETGRRPKVLAVDYLGYWARAYKGEAYERTSAAIMAMKAIAKEFEFPVITPHQVSRMGEAGEEISLNAARDSGVVEETGDFLVALWNADQKIGTKQEERHGHVKAKILKSRHGGSGHETVMQFAPMSLVLAERSGPYFNQAANEHQYVMHNGRVKFDDVMKLHQSKKLYLPGDE